MDNDYAGINDESAKFTSKEDIAARMRDDAAVEMARQIHDWAKDNLSRFDNDGNNRANFGELDLGKRTSGTKEDSRALDYLQNHYKEIQRHSQNRFFFIKGAGGVSTDGIGDYVKELEERRNENEKALQAAIKERSLQAGSRDLLRPMMQTKDGNPNNSLFRVIDGLDGDIDNEISKSDLNKYLENYEKRARYGDINSEYFNPQTRRYVEELRNNWDSASVVRLRGTYTSRDHDGQDKEVPNRKISEESLRKAIGVSKNEDIFAPFVKAQKLAEAPVEAKAKETALPKPPSQDLPEPLPAEKAKKAEPAKVAAAGHQMQESVEAKAPVAKASKTEQKEAKAGAHTAAKPETKDAKAAVKVVRPQAAESKAATAKAARGQESASDEKQAKQETQIDIASPWKVPPQAVEPMDVSAAVADRMRNNYEKAEEYFARSSAESQAENAAALTRSLSRLEWAKDNLQRFDTSGDKRLNYGELDLGIRTTSGEDRSMLKSMQNDYESLKEDSGGLFQRSEAISEKGLSKDVEKKQETLDKSQEAYAEEARARKAEAEKMHMLTGLLSTSDGNPNRSLFRVIDGLDNDIDNEISRRDLSRYLDEYERRSRYGDVGQGYFSRPVRSYVEFLKSNWDSPQIRELRGTYRDNEHREQAYDHLKLERLKEQIGLSKNDDIFRKFTLLQ